MVQILIWMVDFTCCSENSPFCLGLTEYNYCGNLEKASGSYMLGKIGGSQVIVILKKSMMMIMKIKAKAFCEQGKGKEKVPGNYCFLQVASM